MFFAWGGCVITDPYEAAGIDYKLPRTDAKITLDLDVTDCVDAKGSDQVKITPTVKIDAVAGAQEIVYHLKAADLLTATTKRSLTVDVDANGVISSVNSTATDQTAAIVGDVIKIAATVAAGAAAPGTPNPVFVCKDTTKAYVNLVKYLQKQINAKVLALSGAKDQAAAQKEIDDLATRLAAYKAKLHVETTAIFTIDKAAQGPSLAAPTAGTAFAKSLIFDVTQLSPLFMNFQTGPAAPTPNPFELTRAREEFISMAAFYVLSTTTPAIGDKTAGTPDACDQHMFVPAGQAITVVLVPGSNYGKLDPTNPAVTSDNRVTASMVAAQLNSPSRLCLSAGFGENRNLALKFDSFGRTTEFTYAPDSRANNIASALAGSASDLSNTASSISGRKLADQKKELDELQTQQSLVTARACQQAMAAGATSCPKN